MHMYNTAGGGGVENNRGIKQICYVRCHGYGISYKSPHIMHLFIENLCTANLRIIYVILKKELNF